MQLLQTLYLQSALHMQECDDDSTENKEGCDE